ncbi:hypothetical protein [Streptomyces sp. NPDC004065]|uniref:hypothetical protein n=1 Tax=Streptomyces sp. NPDC004065 TaxID=3364689 RepID=UPI00384CCE42
MGAEIGAQSARSRALAVLRVRSRAVAVALLPAALAVILLAGGTTGHLVGRGWDLARWVVGAVAVVVLLLAAGIALVVARARPAMSPTVPIAEESAPDLYRMVRDLADRLGVPAPSAIALTPDCDSWLEDRTHPAHGPPPRTDADEPDLPRGVPRPRRTAAAPVLVIGSPFLWWMRVAELRAVLAPVVAGTGPSAHPDIAAARRFVRGLDAAVAVASSSGRRALSRSVCAVLGWAARLLLRGCREHAAVMERGVASAAAERAQAVDYGLRIVAQEQVGLAYAGWDRLLTRVALPAWRMGRWPSRLDAGVVAALTELSRRDRLAEGFASRLGERPACDLLEEPGAVDEAASLLAARLFHGGPAERSPDWAPVDWHEYPEEVVDRKWRTDAARLHRVLDSLGVRPLFGATGPGPTLARVLDHLSAPPHPAGTSRPSPTTTTEPTRPTGPTEATGFTGPTAHDELHDATGGTRPDGDAPRATGPTIPEHPATPPTATTGTRDATGTAGGTGTAGMTDATDTAGGTGTPDTTGVSDTTGGHGNADSPGGTGKPGGHEDADADADAADAADSGDSGEAGEAGEADDADEAELENQRAAALAAGLSAELAREEATAPVKGAGPAQSAARRGDTGQDPGPLPWDQGTLPLFPLQPPRTGRDLLADHVTAMVCCAAMDTAGATPGLDWLDGPSLLINGARAADLGPKVLALVEDGDPEPLRAWLIDSGIRPEKPVRLV